MLGLFRQVKVVGAVGVSLTSEDLPDPNNRVTVDPAGNIVLSYQPNNEEAHKRLIAKLKDLLNHQSKCPPTVTNIMWA